KAATRNATSAEKAQKSAQQDVDSATSALEAAKKMAADARTMREDAAGTARRKIDEASDAGIRNRKWWEEIGDWVTDNWDSIVAVCKVVVAVVGVIAMIVGGPILAAIVIVAGAIVLADTLSKYAKGQATLMDVAFAAMDCIPGAKGITTAAKLAKGMKGLAKGGFKGMAKGLGKGLRKGADDAAGSSKKASGRCKNGDPIDMVSGEMIMQETDVDLPGLLPLALRRTHLSTYRWGRWFGPSWASTLDERLELDDKGAAFATEDGMILLYPVPRPGTSVMPLEGPRWPLDWDGGPGTPLRITDPNTGFTRHFASSDSSTPTSGVFTMPLAAITDRNGLRVDIDRDRRGIPTAVRDCAGRQVHIDTRHDRVTGLRLHNPQDGPDGTRLRRFGYDAAGNLTEIYDSGDAPLTLTYDSRGRITSWTDRIGCWYRFTYDDADRCIRGEGADGRLSCTIAYEDERRTTRYTDSSGHTRVYRHNELRQLVAETDPLGNTTYSEWDRYNSLLSRTDPLGLTTRYQYDQDGFPTAVVRPDGSTEHAENGSYGQPVTVTQADGHVWHLEYDERGNLTGETDPTGARISYHYDERGALTTVTDAAGRSATLEPDATGQPLSSTDAEGFTTRYERDAFGRVVVRTESDGSVTRFDWTPEGRLTRRTLPDGGIERQVHDPEGNLVQHTDELGRVTCFEYSGFDLPSARVDPDGSRLEFGYDDELRVTSVTNQLGESWCYTYDEAGRLVGERDFAGRAQTYRFDVAGRLTGRTNGAGQSTWYVRDVFGKILQERTAEQTTSYSYDAVGNVLGVRGDHTELTYERDARGRVLAETSNGATIRSDYDVLGRRVRRVTPSGAESLWEYDGRDRPVLLRTAGRTVSFRYDAAGREVERRSGITMLSQSWDPDGRLSSQTLTARHGDPETSDTRLVQRRAYRYRADGAVTAISDLLGGDRIVDVDDTGRVSGVRAATWTERYAYDPAGNLTRSAWQDTSAAPHAPRTGRPVRSSGDVRYELDAQGRVVLRRKKRLSRKPDVWRYTWDSQDRLVGVTTPDGTEWGYRYDPYGRRVAKLRFGPDGESVAEEVTFAWDGFVLAEQVTRHGDETSTCTVWDWEPERFSPVTQLDRVASREHPQEWVDAQFHSIVTDLVGTPTELVDEQGGVTWRSRTTAWGAPLEDGGFDSAYCPLRFPGQYHDPESALHYNYQRHYDPETGQYASADPLGLAPGPNPRAYVPNPFTTIDPLGLAPDCETAARDAARRRADLEQGREGASKKTRPTSAAGLSVPHHDTPFSGASVKGGGQHDLHPDIQAAYDDVPLDIQQRMGGQHGRCGEAEALSDAMKAHVNPRGGVMAAVNVRAEGNAVHGTPKPPCESCADVLKRLNITAVS
ncbi:DUF6531 domain-containing protein, partial [Streptomyces sp. NPDC047123]|uniref:DUF6531 domain-containing protein n=1 Tax=Streptomyces sp. NPDC047123 TaxID=3155622 RepID=UPI0034026842